ncbi:MAG: tetratricopeptide repeat protein [Acidobacteriota bacterium]
MLRIAAFTLVLAAGQSIGGDLELRGSVNDAPPGVRITLTGVDRAFLITTAADPRGDFRFRSLITGRYTLTAGDTRQTVVVNEELAGPEHVIRAELTYSAPAAMVSTRQLRSAGKNPEKVLAKYAEAERGLAESDIATARRKFEEVVAIAPEFSPAWNGLGVVASQTAAGGATAEAHFRRAVDTDPDNVDALLNLGGLLLKTGRAEEALPYNQRAAAAKPHDALAQAQLGMNQYQLGFWDAAERSLQAAKQIDPLHYSMPQIFLAEIYARRGEKTKAIAELEDLLGSHPDAKLAATVRQSIARLQ